MHGKMKKVRARKMIKKIFFLSKGKSEKRKTFNSNARNDRNNYTYGYGNVKYLIRNI